MKKLVFFFVLSISINVFAQNTEASVAYIHMSEEDNLYIAEINRYQYVGDAGLFKAELNYFPDMYANKFGIGIYLITGTPWYGYNEETGMTEFGPILSWKIEIRKIILIPSAYIGFRSYENDVGKGLGTNFSLIVEYPFKKVIPFLDLGFLAQPAGGNDDTDITFGPVFTFGGGIKFNF